MFGLQAAEDEVGQFLQEEEGPRIEEAAKLLQQLLNDCANMRTSCAAQPIAVSRLSLAMLEPLSRLVSPLLMCLKNKLSDAQVLVRYWSSFNCRMTHVRSGHSPLGMALSSLRWVSAWAAECAGSIPLALFQIVARQS